MGDARFNPNAIMKKAQAARPVGVEFGCGIAVVRELRRDIIIEKPENIREVEKDGKKVTEVFRKPPKRNEQGQILANAEGQMLCEDEPAWHEPPMGMTARPLGEPLLDEDYEAHFVLLSVCNHHTAIQTANGGVLQTKFPVCEIGPAIPWPVFLKLHKDLAAGKKPGEE